MTIPFQTLLLCSVLGTGMLLGANPDSQAFAQAQESSLSDFAAAAEPPLFDDPAAAAEALKSALAKDDFDEVAKLLGLDATKLKAGEGVMDTYAKIRKGAAEKVVVRDMGDRKLLDIGYSLWPLPFPITKGDDGKWAFDTYAGMEEIINRRIGENEIEAIATARAYVEAQRDYGAEDRDDDGVLEYAQRMISSEGATDGLYWPADEANGASPAGEFANEAALDKTKVGEGYFGYRFRILTGQGDRIAGGKHDYTINGNMIAGFALLAWPVKYAETGVHTFAVSHHGIVYETDLGPDTEATAAKIERFDPDQSWGVAVD